MIKELIYLFKTTFAFNCITSIFNDDEHEIVSDRGYELLEQYDESK